MGITQINLTIPENQYPNVCYNYIIYNPVKDGLVKKADEWEFSSYSDAYGNKESRIINKARIKELNLGA
jgi:putative transposase